MILENLSTHELQSGDIVLTAYGMRVLISGPGEISRVHPTNEHSPTLWWDGEILNVDEVREDGFVPRAWMSGGRWSIQGNGLAHWRVERP